MSSAGSQGGASAGADPLNSLRVAVEATAGRDPDRIALTDGAESRSYAELARLLEQAGRRRRTGRQALAVGRSLADVETILVESCAGTGLLLVDTGATAWEVERAEALFVEAGLSDAGEAEELALGLCSSGSSGLPKVVELGWESVLRNAACFASAAGYRGDDVLWCTTPLAHLYCFGAGVLGGLLNGATVLLGKGMLEPNEFAGLVRAEEPTLLLSVPFLFRRYMDTLRSEPEIVREWSGSLRGAIAAGEAVPADLIAAWRDLTGVPLHSHYGLTEGGQITLAGGGEEEGVGAPLEGVELRIGRRGEVAVRRSPPARPYRVIGGEPAADGWYETGDLGHLDESGNLHITGRADSRINVAGKKVDPAEVEGALRACQGVDDCAVAGVEGPGGTEVVAFACVDSAAEIDEIELRKELAALLSPHKLPRRFVRVAEIPRTLTGKVRRGELIAGLAQSAASPGHRRDASVLELVRCEAAEVVLGKPAAGAIEPGLSFKELGFDSLAAVSLCEALARATGLRVQATAVFDHPTPIALAAHLETLADGGGDPLRVARPVGFIAEPIAIVGMACRYPGGVDSPQRLWDLVAAGADAISGFPEDRGWALESLYDPDPDRLGTSYAREGGFLADADRFDAEFFGVSPREALAMDPQQRLLLEAAWEALEDAGIDPAVCRGTAAAVFAGVMTRDYAAGSLPESTEGYLTTGLAESVVSGRVAYSLGLEGPAVTVNTACSSSLVALHLACQSLRLEECSLALAGGVSVMATPAQFVEFSRQRGLAPDGRCKSFAAAADGTAWSEGVGLLVLERLSEARRNGHRVLATIRGSAINQDGASNGLTAPNGPSQERVIRQALANAGLEPGDVDAVEAHGTGTTLGDPIEAGALLATYGQGRDRPLKLGSIKSNIGHSLAGAGVAGAIKMVQAMRHGVLPKTLHVDRPSPHVDWEGGKVELLTEPEKWESDGRPRRAGVSSFGISGTNAHLILEQAPAEPVGSAGELPEGDQPPARRIEPIPWLLSAKSETAMQGQAERLLAHLRELPDHDPLDIGFSLATTRSHLPHRAVLLGAGRGELFDSLSALAAGGSSPGTNLGPVGAGKTAFLFTGQGAQRAGMGAELYQALPAFAEALDAVCAELDPHLGQPLKRLLFAGPEGPETELLDQTRFTQPALFAIEVALFRLLESWGVRPDFLAGHSIGELSAAHVAGVFSLRDGCELVAARGRLMGELAEGGAMVAIGAGEEEVREALAGFEPRLSIAAINGPESTVVSGEEEEALRLGERFRERGKKTARLRVSHAFHSQRMEPMLEALADVAAGLDLSPPTIPIVSDITGGLLGPEQASSPEYWARQAREPVRFLDAMRTLADQGATRFLELGPDAVLSAALDDCLDEEATATAMSLLRKDRPEPETLTAALAGAHAAGVEVDWGAFFEGSGAKAVELPTYAFQRRRFWIESAAGSGDPAGAGQAAVDHPLLGAEVRLAGSGERVFTGRLSLQTHPWLADHAVGGVVLLAGTAYVDLALSIGAELGAEALEELIGEAPLVLPETGAMQIQLAVGEPDRQGRCSLRLHSRPEGDPEAEWTRNATGTLAPSSSAPPEGLSAWPPPGAEPISLDFLYERLAESGFEYGPAFQGLRAAWRKGEELFAEVELGEERAGAFAIHPALLDAALQLGFLAEDEAPARLPFSWSDVRLHRPASSLRVRLTPAGEDGFSLLGADSAGVAAISVERLALRPLEPGSLPSPAGPSSDSLFRLLWREVALPEGDETPAEPWHCRPEPGPDPVAAAQDLAERVLAELQRRLAEEEEEGKEPPRLALVTHGALAVAEGEAPDLSAAPLWGLLRSAQVEHPGRFALIDTDDSEASGEALQAALALAEEPQLAIREGRVLAARLERGDPSARSVLSADRPWRLDVVEKGTLENLALVADPQASAPLAPTEVRVAVGAAGLNFRDVLIALGSYPGEAPIGSEGAGVVVEVGDAVSDLVPGERVFGLIDNAFGPLAVSERRMLARLPAGWSQAEGAAVPIASLTALYGLRDLAATRPGEKVLIHAAAGGVGGFALQLARHFGAEVYATAHPDKWGELRAAGLDREHIASSRDLEFKQRFLATGEGVDVVLNSLAGEFVDASLDLLRPGGRLLEIGKADIRDPEQIAASHPGVAYRAYDLIEAGPERIEAMLGEVVELFERGALRMPSISSWDVRSGAGAFRFMSQGRHVGKIVLSVPQPPPPGATTLITGAGGTLGALLARHVVKERGARNLILCGRRGERAPGAKELAAELEALGASVRIAACDVARRDQLQELIASIPAEAPLKTVIHAAGVIDDGVIASLDPERLQTVFAPKARGAWNLHELTKGSELSEFVLFSSVAATLGSPGQANYAAANAFLDALAQRRQSEGLPATAIAWGLWATQSAMTGELSEADLARIRRAGMAPLSDARGLELFDAALAGGEPFNVATPLEPAVLRSRARAGELAAILSGLVRLPARRSASGGSLAPRLADLPEPEREAAVLELVRSEAATVLGHAGAAAIDPERAFKELGFDSLAAVELRNRLKAVTGLRLPSTLVFDHPSVAAVSAFLCEQVGDAGSRPAAVARTPAGEEPIAIVGMACRFPGGVESPRDLWSLVAGGEDGIAAFPADRGWDLERLYDPDPDVPGTSYAREGGFLDAADRFDADFFGIGPREALATDPQQRLLLEAAWEAFEQAGIDPSSLRGAPAGVFSGISSSDYGPTLRGSQELEGHAGTGNLGSVLSGRVAYQLGLEGPAITIDTACSASLVAMHLAAGALRGGECTLALAGGVTVLSTPDNFIDFSRQRGLAADGRCKSFAEGADGTGFSEGVGMLVLERLSDAERNGRRILAVIRGSAVNQDGASNGLTAPNGPSQERVIRQALANARLTPQEVDAVEAHGTGTTLGDPIEAGALLATYGQDREAPLKLGSIKSNIGHTQAAAGVAGVIKTVMAMREGVLPKTLHVDRPSTKVDWEAGEVELLREAVEWKADGRPRRAGVSSFGISGTNAHLILEEAPEPAIEAGEGEQALPGPIPFLLSAKSQSALRAQASRLGAHLRDNPEPEPLDVAFSLAATRSAFEHRAVAWGTERAQISALLDSLAEGRATPGALLGRAARAAKLAFLFSGQGSQRPAMGRELYEAYPAYAEAFDRACAHLDPELEHPLAGVVFATPGSAESSLLDHTSYAQPALFATGVALFGLLESRGLRPDLLCGHSIGEISAAHLAGVLGLADAAKLVAARGRLMGELPGGGAMVAIEASEAEVKESIAGKGQGSEIAAVNAPGSVVLSGAEEAIEAAESHWRAEGRKTKRLAVSHAFHSALMEPMLAEFEAVARGLDYAEPGIPIVSNLSGELLGAEQATDPAYWVAHAREPVRFMDGVRTLAAQGVGAYVEIGPDPVLTAMAQECLAEEQATPFFAPALRKDRPEPETLTAALAGAHAAGVEVDWGAFFEGSGAKAVELPTYAFQRRRFWIESAAGSGDPAGAGQAAVDHPLLGAEVRLAGSGERVFTGRLSLQTHPWLADHAVGGVVLLAGTALLELALQAGTEAGATTVRDLTLTAPLVVPATGGVWLQVSVAQLDEQGVRELSIYSRPEGDGPEPDGDGNWTLNASGALVVEASVEAKRLAAWPPPGARPLDLDDLYEQLAEMGLEYGPAFQGLTAAWRDGKHLYAEVSLPPERAAEAGRFCLHPALLDAGLHAIAAGQDEQSEGSRLPFAWGDVRLAARGASAMRIAVTDVGQAFRLDLADDRGEPIATIGSLALRAMAPVPAGHAAGDPDGLFGVEWQKHGLLDGGEPAETFALELDDSTDPAAPTRAALEAVQSRLASESQAEGRLAIVTRGAIAAEEGDSPDPATAAAWGLLRSAQSEHPGRFLLIDSDGSAASAAALAKALQAQEPQLALREGEALAPRAIPFSARADSLLPPAGAWRLDAGPGGTLEGLALLPNPAATEPLAPDEVRIAVRAAGLNFRDVLIALDLYPGEATIGSEGAGVVVEVGSEVADLSPGDRVMGLLSGAFGPLVVARRPLIVPIPAAWSFEQAASLPTVFLTAQYGLFDLARLEPGEKVLIHAGAGGVGMAAIQIAQHRGAEVFATAGPSKWDLLREAGLDDDHIASSRELDFKDAFLAVTDGEGVDVVLNSLAGEFVDASLALLPRGGRFIEIGKSDLRDPEQVAAAHRGVSYSAFDLLETGTDRLGEMLAEIVDLVESGALRHSPIRSWDLRCAPEAFRHLREGKNVGKVVFEIPRLLDPEKTVLLTGATGGLGAILARHLAAEHGARHLLLASRSGPEAPGAAELREELEALGAEATIVTCDVSERKQLELLLASIPAAHPLDAVIHAAGAIDDATIEALEPAQVDRVFAPKANAAWHLHELTAGLELSAFVMFSSAAGVLGAPGQGNYAAANAFLDALAEVRQAEGLPAASIAWGLWQRESAMTSHLEEADLSRMRRSGVVALSDQQGLALFDRAIGSGRSGALALGLDRGALRAQARAGLLPPVFSALVRTPVRRPSTVGPSLAAKLADLDEAEREPLVADLVRAETAAVLGHGSASAIEPTRTFKELGFDSLAAVELRNRLQAATGLRLTSTAVFDYPTAAALAGFLAASVGPDGGAEPALESGERQIREALISIPLSRLRKAGLLDSLLRLAGADAEAGPEVEESGELIDTMDVEELIRESAGGAPVESRQGQAV